MTNQRVEQPKLDMQPWWKALYDEPLADLLLVRTDQKKLKKTIDFLIRHLAIQPEDTVFDQCCGIGSLSIALAEANHHVIGVDQAASYIERAREIASASTQPNLESKTSFWAADAFEFVPRTPCDAALNWWTSFGYADTDTDNSKMFDRAFEALKPGGRFALDYLNLPSLLRSLKRHVVIRKQSPDGEITLIRETEIDVAGGVINKLWTYFLPGGERREHTSRLRLYMPHQVTEMLQLSGFTIVEMLGSVGGEPIDVDSPRCIVIAERT